MKQLVLKTSALLFAVAITSACTVTPVQPPRGILFTDHRAPLFPGDQTGEKTGESKAEAILGLVAYGDSGIGAATENGNISEISHIDYRNENYIFGIYQRYTTIVKGQ